MNLLIAATLDLTIVIALALAVTSLLSGRSASLRHAIVAAAMLAAAAGPVFEAIVPQWEVPIAWGTAQYEASTLALTSSAAPEPLEAATAVSSPQPIAWMQLLVFAWIAGVITILGRLVTGLVRLKRAARRCRLVDAGAWHDLTRELSWRHRLRYPVVVLQSADTTLLLTWGLFRPKILLPAGSDTWSAQRREVVLAHEIAHIRRHDWALQIAAEMLRAVYWFNPLVWVACRRLRQESEYACDDAVLDAGVEPTEYATHLLDVARLAVGHTRSWAAAPAVALPSTLERRIAAMLSQHRNRAPLTRRAYALAVAGVVVVTVPIAAINVTARAADPVATVAAGRDVALVTGDTPNAPLPRPTPAAARNRPPAAAAQQSPAAITGVVQDQSGAVLPGAELTLTDTEFGVRNTAVTDATGSFGFRELQPSRYELVFKLPGFATVTNVMSVAAGANIERRVTLPVGTLQETITVGCSGAPVAVGASSGRVAAMLTRGSAEQAFVATDGQRALRRSWTRAEASAAPQDQTATGPRPVRVGGQIRVPRQIFKVNPVCPRTIAPANDTVVNLVGRVGVDGYMNDVRLVARETAAPPAPEFVDSALEAVRQWKYLPTLLNGEPIEVNISILVAYSRMGGDRR
jgi:beta-lactamase regulating signal transducer with metallopeptidase domain